MTSRTEADRERLFRQGLLAGMLGQPATQGLSHAAWMAGWRRGIMLAEGKPPPGRLQ